MQKQKTGGRPMRYGTKVSLAVVALVAVSAAAFGAVYEPRKSAAARAGFVYREGKTMMLNGRPYTFASVNSFQMTGCGHANELFSEAALNSTMAAMQDNTMIRTWAFRGNEGGIERAVRAAERNNVKLMLTLSDGRSHCGEHDGFKGSDGSGKHASWYSGGYKTNFLPHARAMAAKYKDSPAVGAWEIINEPGDADYHTIRRFYDDVSANIKAVDPNHLISSGAWAPWTYGEAGFKVLHESPGIDIVGFHEYDYDYKNSRTIISPHFWPTKRVADALNKPHIVGETGIKASASGCFSSPAQRRDGLKAKYDQYLANGSSGVLVWNLTGGAATGCGFSFSTSDISFNMIANYKTPGTGDGSAPPTTTPAPAPAPTPAPAPADPVSAGSINDDRFTYTGSWQVARNSGSYQGDDHYSSSAGAGYSLGFSGTGVKVYAAKAPHHGIMAVSIDNGPEVPVDLYAAARADQALVYTSPALAAGPHTLKVRVTGAKNAASGGTVINADRIDVAQVSTQPLPVIGDLNGDAKISITDLSVLLSRWGSADAGADLNKDGTVSITDLSILLSKWSG